MENTKKIVEQRKHERFQIQDCAYAVLRDKPTQIGQIINMSRDGLAVCYSSEGPHLSMPAELDIFIMDTHFYMNKIALKTIYDFEIEDTSAFDSEKTRCRGFQFEEIKSGQLFQLDYLLENYTMERRSDPDRGQIDA